MPSFQDIQDLINKAVDDFDKGIPTLQRNLLDNITEELRGLDLKADGSIEVSVNNIRLLGKIKGQLGSIILNDDYIEHVKNFADAFNQVATLQNDYWIQVESTFKPAPLLAEIRKQSINATIDSLTESGIGANISQEISDILQTNIGSGGTMKNLEQQLRTSLTNIGGTDGLLLKYTRQITTDSINQFTANYNKIIADSFGFEWYGYQGSDIATTRPFCDAMTDFRYFHVSQVPALLLAHDLYYLNRKTGERELVPIYAKTGLPQGMPAGEDANNFFILRGGYNCSHQTRPMPDVLIPENIKTKVEATPAYKTWRFNHPKKA